MAEEIRLEDKDLGITLVLREDSHSFARHRIDVIEADGRLSDSRQVIVRPFDGEDVVRADMKRILDEIRFYRLRPPRTKHGGQIYDDDDNPTDLDEV